MIWKFNLGLGFRPQPYIEKNIIIVNTKTNEGVNDTYVKSLEQYLQICKEKLEY